MYMKKETKKSRQEIEQEALRLSLAGLSTRDIARRLGTSHVTIARILKQTTTTPSTSMTSSPRESHHITPDATTIAVAEKAAEHYDGIISLATKTLRESIEQLSTIIPAETDTAKLSQIVTRVTDAIDKLDTMQKRCNIVANTNVNDSDGATTNAFTTDFSTRHTTKPS